MSTTEGGRDRTTYADQLITAARKMNGDPWVAFVAPRSRTLLRQITNAYEIERKYREQAEAVLKEIMDGFPDAVDADHCAKIHRMVHFYFFDKARTYVNY